MDAIPHFDQGSFRTLKSEVLYLGGKERLAPFDFLKLDWIILFADFAIGGIVFILLLFKLPVELWTPLVAGVFGCLLPDIIDSSPLWSLKLRAKFKAAFYYHEFHIVFHWTTAKNQAVLGLSTQIVFITISLWYLLS